MSGGSDIISTILTDLGWDENMAVPIANEENQKLLHLIDLKQRQTETNKNDLERICDKLSSMTNHLKNCRQELLHSGKLKTAKEAEKTSEEHMEKIEEREIGRLRQELNKMELRVKDIYQNKNIYENTLYKKTTELEELKQQMKWDKQALEAWLEESEKKGEDILSLQRYARQDEAKISELSLQLERCTATINEKRTVLEKEVVETKTTHVELEKTTDEFRKAHDERQNILAQWEGTIDQLRRRDSEIDSLSAKLALLKYEVQKLQDELKSKNEFYDNLLKNNADMENNIDLIERQSGKLRVEYKEVEESRFNLLSELEALKRTCARTASDLEQARVTISQLKKEKLDKDLKKARAKVRSGEASDQLKRIQDEKMTAEERANIADKMLAEEESSHVRFEQSLKHTRDLQFRSAQELHDVETEQRNLVAEISGNSSAVKNLTSQVQRLDQDLLKQQEILYGQEFAVQQLERRVGKMRGEAASGGGSDERERLETEVAQLEEHLGVVTKTAAQLVGQTRSLAEERRRGERDAARVRDEHERVSARLEESELSSERGAQELGRCRGAKAKFAVEASILRLQVSRLRERLYGRAEKVYTLDVRKQQLEQAIRERFAEISIHKDMIQQQTRSAEEERSKINMDLKSRLSKIDKLEKRFEIITVSMAPPDGEEEQSQAYYVIKAAQEKEALQRQGDELDAKIRKTEREIRALENTLTLMDSCNHNYRRSLTRVTDVSEEAAVKKDMETQLRTVMDSFNFRRRQLVQMEEDLQMLRETHDNLSKDEQLYREQVDSLTDQLIIKESEISRHREKMDRAETVIVRLRREILDSSALAKNFAEIEEDIKLRERREFARIAVGELGRQIQQQHSGLSSLTRQYLEQAGLAGLLSPNPSQPASSSGGSSRRSTPASSTRPPLQQQPQRGPAVVDVTLGAASSHRSFTSESSRRSSAQSSVKSGRSGMGSVRSSTTSRVSRMS